MKTARYQKKCRIILIYSILYICCFNSCSNVLALDYLSDDPITAVHYFGNAWPITFWNSIELSHVDKDFERIKKDGFNTVILVVPWGEFQPKIKPAQYNTQALNLLERIVEKAKNHNLKVILRLPYFWDYAPDVECPLDLRFLALFYDSSVLNAFIEFLEKIYALVGNCPNFLFGFCSWEDFKLSRLLNLGDLDLAQKLGYQDFLKAHYSLPELSKVYGSYLISYKEIPFPKRTSHAYKLFLEFEDYIHIEKLYKPAKRAFPKLSMEVRVDWDPVYLNNELISWFSHEKTFNLPGSEITTAYYSTCMGFENVGDTQPGDAVLQQMNSVLQNLFNKSGKKKIFIDQFVYGDNSPQFKNNTNVVFSHLNDFIVNSVPLLLKYTIGYALWTYRDYKANALYNSSFEVGLKGWEVDGRGDVIILPNGDKSLLLRKGSSIKQFVSRLNAIASTFVGYKKVNLRFKAKLLNDSAKILKVSVNSNTEKFIVASSEREYCLTLPNKDTEYQLSIKAINGDIVIDDIYFYAHVQKGLVYKENYYEDSALKAFRKLNSLLIEKSNLNLCNEVTYETHWNHGDR